MRNLDKYVIVGMILIFLSPYNGPINAVLKSLGKQTVNFIGLPKLCPHVYVWSGIWRSAGWERTPKGKIRYLDASKKEPNWQKLWGGLPGWAWYQGRQIPFTWLSPEKGNEASQYLTDLRKLTAETMARWVSGQGAVRNVCSL